MEENNSNIPFAAEEELLSTAIDMLSAEKEITAEESAQPVAEEAQAEKEEQATYNGLPKVESTFEDLGVSGEILKAIKEMGYESPMPVQEKVIPYLLGHNNDVVALAQTGTGKTAAGTDH